VERNFVVAHEVGHGINRIAGQPTFGPKGTVFNIPQEGVVQQMRYVYNDLNNPTLAYRREYSPNVDPASNPSLRGYGPEQLGYPKAEVPGELMAETIRAYFADPNYIKTVAPKAAARAREFVNNHPQLSPIIQLNSATAPVAGPIAAEMLSRELMRKPPSDEGAAAAPALSDEEFWRKWRAGDAA
jgi:hypothetical protein